jgi:3D (Asp-Asp-Asp) domain-containing protein
MRILATLALVGIAFGSLSFSSKAFAQGASDQSIDTEQKSKDESNTTEDKVISLNDNFVASAYVPEVNPKKLAYFERWRKRTKRIDYSQLPKGDFTINASAYTAAADECGKSDGITASGRKVAEGRTLACPPGYVFGTKIEIDGMGTYTCEDRGGAIKGNHFDIYMQTKSQAFAFGRKNLVARVVR